MLGALRVEFGDQHVASPGAGKGSAAEVDQAVRVASDDGVPVGVQGDAYADLNLLIAETLTPQMSSIGVELGEEHVVQSQARKRAATEVHRAQKAAGDEHVAKDVSRDARAVLYVCISERLTPYMGTVRVELGDEDIPTGSTNEGAAAKIDRAAEIARDDNVAGAVCREALTKLYVSIAEALAPQVSASGVELGDEGVLVSCAREWPITEINRTFEVARDENVIGAVHRDTLPSLVVQVAKILAPQVGAIRAELDDEDIRVAGACENTSAEVDGAVKVTRDDDIARAVNREPLASFDTRASESLAPDSGTVHAKLGNEDIGTPGAGNDTAAEVSFAIEVTCNKNVAGAIRGDTLA